MSLFVSVPSDIDRRTVIICDAVETLFEAVEYHYSNMQRLAEERSRLQRDAGSLVPMVAEVTALVATINRLRLLVQRFPLGKAERPARQAFARAVKSVEPVRHHLEHLDSELLKTANPAQGAFGAIAFWRSEIVQGRQGLTCCAMVPGTLAVGQQAVTQFPGVMRAAIDHFWVLLAGEQFDLSDVFYATMAMKNAIDTWAQGQGEVDWRDLRRWKHQGSSEA